jgi:hypothetical protein
MSKTATYALIDGTTLTSATGTVTFTSIPGRYTDLRLVINGRGTATTYQGAAIQFNSDTTTNYSWTGIFGDGASSICYRATNQSNISGEQLPRSNDTAGMFGVTMFDIMDYANTTRHKSVLVRNASTGTTCISYLAIGLWRKTPEAITSITINGSVNFAIGSTFKLYGIEAGNA